MVVNRVLASHGGVKARSLPLSLRSYSCENAMFGGATLVYAGQFAR
jgi:hypothetical protein